MAEKFLIILPLPPKVLSPNCAVATPGGRFAKAAAAKKYRVTTKRYVESELIESAPWGKVFVKAAFFYGTKRRRDQDNAMFSLKAMYDGIVDSGLVADDTPGHMKREIPVLSIDRDFPRVEITIERLA